MTADLDDTRAGEDRLAGALRDLADGWAAAATVPPWLFASRARSAWRRKVVGVTTASTFLIAGVVTLGVAVAPAMRAAVAPVTLSATSPPATPPAYPGYTAQPLGVIAQTTRGGFVVRSGTREPDYSPVVNTQGFVGVTDGALGGTNVRDLDRYSAGGVTDQAFGVTIQGAKANPGVGSPQRPRSRQAAHPHLVQAAPAPCGRPGPALRPTGRPCW